MNNRKARLTQRSPAHDSSACMN